MSDCYLLLMIYHLFLGLVVYHLASYQPVQVQPMFFNCILPRLTQEHSSKDQLLTVFTVTSVPIICPSLSLSLALSVYPTVEAYILVTMSWILMKLVESV